MSNLPPPSSNSNNNKAVESLDLDPSSVLNINVGILGHVDSLLSRRCVEHAPLWTSPVKVVNGV